MISALQLTGTAGAMQLTNARRAAIHNMGGLAVANYVSVLEAMLIAEFRRIYADFGVTDVAAGLALPKNNLFAAGPGQGFGVLVPGGDTGVSNFHTSNVSPTR
nr:hypothetical protein [Cryobacterium sp. Y50]